MRRAALAIVSTIAGLVLLLSFKTHSATSRPPAVIGTADPGGGAATTPSSSASSSASSTSTAKRPSSSATRTVTGSSVDTQWGPVQVQLTVRSGKITKVSVVEYPNGNPRDQEINSYAIPQLVQETLAAQSDKIDIVSGATVTSDGYVGSLQSALDKAGL
jgi:uncharacterized protein with FMN-binding domain